MRMKKVWNMSLQPSITNKAQDHSMILSTHTSKTSLMPQEQLPIMRVSIFLKIFNSFTIKIKKKYICWLLLLRKMKRRWLINQGLIVGILLRLPILGKLRKVDSQLICMEMTFCFPSLLIWTKWRRKNNNSLHLKLSKYF